MLYMPKEHRYILMWTLTYAPTDFKTFKPNHFVILHSTRTHDTVNLSDSISSSVSYITHTQPDYDTQFPPLPVTSTPAKNETTFMPSPITSPLKCTSQKKRRIKIAQPVCLSAVSDKKYYDKKKDKLPHTHQKNIADHFQHINNIVHTHPLVRDVIYSKDHVPSIILYTDEQIKDVKRFCASDNTAETTVLGVDKTYNLSQLHVTVTTFKNIALLRQSTNTHPLFLGPILIHGNSDFSTFSRFFETLKRELIDAPSSPIFGSDEERALTKAIKHSFPDSHLLSCVRHLKSNTINYLTDKVGVTSDVRLEITNSIYGENSMAGATDDIIFEIRRDRTLALVEQHAPTFLTYFNTFITPKLKDNMRTYNQHPTINPKWTNNNSESMNHILKLNNNWQSKPLADLINLIHTEITTAGGKKINQLKRCRNARTTTIKRIKLQ